MMKRSGYPSHFAAAVETAASCGGTILPPVMGAVAFVIADILGIRYIEIVVSAAIPAILYYAAVFYSVDIQAIKGNLKGEDRSMLPGVFKTLISGIQYIFPFVWLLYRLFQGISPTRCAFEAIIAMLVVGIISGFVNKNLRGHVTFDKVIKGIGNSIFALLPVAVACTAAGIIIGMVSFTGLGSKFSSLILSFGQGLLLPILFLTAILVMILGMGMSITPTYVLGAALAAPAMVELGIAPIAAHLFIMYFAGMATMTPPVCLAAYTAAGISGDDALKVGFTAVKIGIVAYVIPFVFIYSPSLLLIVPFSIYSMITFVTTIIGVASLTIGVNRFLIQKLNIVESFSYIGACILLIFPDIYISIAGVIVFTILLIYNYRKIKFKKLKNSNSEITSA